MTIDEFRKSKYYTPEAERVLGVLKDKYGDFMISPPLISLDRSPCCLGFVELDGFTQVFPDRIPIKKGSHDGW